MVKQWVQPPINKNRLPPGGFLLGSHLTSFIVFFIIIKVFIGILGESFEIELLAIFFYEYILMRDLIKFETEFLVFIIQVVIGILGKASKSSFWQYVISIIKRDWIKFEIVLLSLLLGFSLEYQGHPSTKYQQIINIDHGVFQLGRGGRFSNRGINSLFFSETPLPTFQAIKTFKNNIITGHPGTTEVLGVQTAGNLCQSPRHLRLHTAQRRGHEGGADLRQGAGWQHGQLRLLCNGATGDQNGATHGGKPWSFNDFGETWGNIMKYPNWNI